MTDLYVSGNPFQSDFSLYFSLYHFLTECKMSDIVRYLSFVLVVCDDTWTCALLSYFRQHSSQHIQTCLRPHPRKCKAHLEPLKWLLTLKADTDRWKLGYALVYFLFLFLCVLLFIASVFRHCYVAHCTSSFSVYQTVYFAVISWFVILSFYRAIPLACFLKKVKPNLIDPSLV